MKKYIISLDQGTTSSRAIIFDREQNIVEIAQKEFEQIYPQPGYVEHDPLEIYASQYGVLVEVLAKSGVNPDEVAAIGITNQRETTIVWDKHTGRPIYNAIVWQCRRTAGICEQMKQDGMEPYVKQTTGLIIDAYFFGHQDQVDPRPCRGRAGEGAGGGSAVWHGGQLADLETDRRRGSCDRLHQRLPDDAVLTSAGCAGTKRSAIIWAFRCRCCPPSATPARSTGMSAFRGWTSRSRALRGTSRRRSSDRPALKREMQRHLWHRLLLADEHRRRDLPQQKRAALHHRHRSERQGPLCAGGQRLRGGRCGAVAAG